MTSRVQRIDKVFVYAFAYLSGEPESDPSGHLVGGRERGRPYNAAHERPPKDRDQQVTRST